MFLRKRATKTDEEKRLKMLEEISRKLDDYIEHGWGLHRDHTFKPDPDDPISQLQEKLYQAFERVYDEEILDALTRLWNRKFMTKILESGLKVAQREHQNFCIALVDVDGLIHVNHDLDHQTGDQVLIELAKRIEKVFHPGDWVGRIGGDEFQIALHQNLEHAKERLERFRLEIEQNSLLPEDQREGFSKYLTENGIERKVTISIGLTTVQPNDTLEDCITRTDIAMHRAKNNGKNRLELA